MTDARPDDTLATSNPPQFLERLASSVTDAVPDALTSGVLTVDRDRSLADRLAGRPGDASRLSLTVYGELFTLEREGERWRTEIARVSGGVTIARRKPPLGEWLTEFAGRIAMLAVESAGDSAASARALQALGVRPPGDDIRVRDDSIGSDLRELSPRLAGRVPAEAAVAIGRIGELLADTLARLDDNADARRIVSRTATIYLPDTIRAYLTLPTDWASDHVLGDGRTSAQAFIEQLQTIEAAAAKMRDAAVERNAQGLIDNGRFLASRFAVSGLDLPHAPSAE